MTHEICANDWYIDGNLSRINYMAQDEVERSIPELVRKIRGDLAGDETYENSREPVSITMVDPKTNEVVMHRPLTQSELELFAIELSKAPD